MFSDTRKRILVIGLVWPEPTSSAAGWRMLQLLGAFKQEGYEIYFLSSAQQTEHSFDLTTEGVHVYTIQINDSAIDSLLKEIDPSIVLFDRFITEEQFGWRVMENLPNALRILDTEDLHSLRHLRGEAISEVELQSKPEAWNTTYALRELSSILRSDLSLMISKKEMDLLTKTLRISESLLHEIPFMEAPLTREQLTRTLSYHQRKHFVFIGNYLHKPNKDTIKVLVENIWPKIRAKDSSLELHIYGAYLQPNHTHYHNPKKGIFVYGRAENARVTLEKYRVLLAPIPFGAGIKGKIIDSIASGTVPLTSPIGGEGIFNRDNNSFCISLLENFPTQALELYKNQDLWDQIREDNRLLFNDKFNQQTHTSQLLDRIERIRKNLNTHRSSNIMGSILQLNQMRATKYMSLWIEEKNKTKHE